MEFGRSACSNVGVRSCYEPVDFLSVKLIVESGEFLDEKQHSGEKLSICDSDCKSM